MPVDLSPDEVRFIIAAMEAIRVQNKAGLQTKYSVVTKLIAVLPDDVEVVSESQQKASQAG